MSPARIVEVAHDVRRVLACDSCPRTWSSETSLAAHLMDIHQLSTEQAVEAARRIAHTSKANRKGDVMAETNEKKKQARHCRTCGMAGHRADNCPNARVKREKAARVAPRAQATTRGDREIRALGAVLDALQPLDSAARRRVIEYALTRFAIASASRK